MELRAWEAERSEAFMLMKMGFSAMVSLESASGLKVTCGFFGRICSSQFLFPSLNLLFSRSRRALRAFLGNRYSTI